MKRPYEILLEDDHILVVNKKAGLLTIPDRFDVQLENLSSLLKLQHEEIRILHRLDRETSGLICFAKNESAHKALSKQFEERQVQKIYHALIDGHPSNIEGSIDKPISLGQKGKMLVSTKGKEALTLYKVQEQFKKFAWVEVEIKTGRTHQIRVHFETIGHSLAVDKLYGKRKALFLSEFKLKKYRRSKFEEEKALLSRTSLHSSRLSFTHPISKEKISVEAPLPKDLKATLNQLRKWASILV